MMKIYLDRLKRLGLLGFVAPNPTDSFAIKQSAPFSLSHSPAETGIFWTHIRHTFTLSHTPDISHASNIKGALGRTF